MSSGRKRRSSSLYKTHPLYGTIVRNSFSIDLSRQSSVGITLYRIVFKVIERETQEEKDCYVWQRFKNFQVLSKKLEDFQKLSGDSVKLPKLINARYFDRFKQTVIEERIKSCVELLHFIGRHNHLVKSDVFIEFLLDFKYLEHSLRNQSISEVSVSSVDTVTMDVDPTQGDPQGDDEILSTSNPWEPKELTVTCSPDHNVNDNLIQFDADCNVDSDIQTDGVANTLQKPVEDSLLNVRIPSPASLASSDDEEKSVTESYAKKLLSTSPEGLEWSTAVSLTPKGSDTEEDIVSVNQTQPSDSPATVSPMPINSNLTVIPSGTKQSSSPPSWWSSALQETDELASIDEMDSDKLQSDSKPVVDTSSSSTGNVTGLNLEGILNKPPVDDIVMPQFSEQFSLQAPLSPEVDTSSPQAYLLQSGKMIREALELERRHHYSKAFEILKAGVGLLLRGVQMDSDPIRREAVRKKISGYLRHAEKLYKQHINTKEPSQPHYISDFKVLEVLKKCMLVRSKHSGELFVVKTLHKTLTGTRKVGKANKPSKNRSLFPCPFMVKFLHHYETTSSIYLLLEYVTGGNILEVIKAEKDRFVRRKAGISTPVEIPQEDGSEDCNDETINALLSQLESPPNAFQSDEQLSVHSLDSEENSVTSLKALRKALEESGVDTSSLDEERPPPSPPPLTIEPPTPTTPVTDKIPNSVTEEFDNLIANDVSAAGTEDVSNVNNETKPFRKYSPGAAHKHLLEETELTNLDVHLEECVRKWMGQLVIALEHLHTQGVICRDLHPENILISEDGELKLTYFGNWDNIQPQINPQLAEQLYVAPELCGTGKPLPSVDWWSLGVILYETLTGLTLCSCHPGGINSHCELEIPAKLSPEARSLIKQLLQVNPKERLGSSMNGVGEIKSHPFFANFNWSNVVH